MSVDREIRHNLEFTYARLAGESPERALWLPYSAGKGGGAATIRVLDRFLSMMNERGDPGTIPLATLASGSRRSMGRNEFRYVGEGWMIGQANPGQEGWVTERLFLATDGTLLSGENAQKTEREVDRPALIRAQSSVIDSIPRHIGNTLAENGLEWLPQVPEVGYGPKPRLDGLYMAREDSGSSYLRFSSGGRVSYDSSTGSLAEVATWLGPEATDSYQGIYDVEDAELYFGASTPQSLIVFHGRILGANGALTLLSRHSVPGYIGYRENRLFTFVPLPMG